MKRGEELTHACLKKEFKRLSKAVDKAKAEYDEYMNIHHEMIAIRKEFAEIVKSQNYGESLEKLDSLKKRSARCERIRKKDLVKLMDNHIDLQLERDSIGQEMARIEFRLNLRGRNLKQEASK